MFEHLNCSYHVFTALFFQFLEFPDIVSDCEQQHCSLSGLLATDFTTDVEAGFVNGGQLPFNLKRFAENMMPLRK